VRDTPPFLTDSKGSNCLVRKGCSLKINCPSEALSSPSSITHSSSGERKASDNTKSLTLSGKLRHNLVGIERLTMVGELKN
jgi:hypothetical protein